MYVPHSHFLRKRFQSNKRATRHRTPAGPPSQRGQRWYHPAQIPRRQRDHPRPTPPQLVILPIIRILLQRWRRSSHSRKHEYHAQFAHVRHDILTQQYRKTE